MFAWSKGDAIVLPAALAGIIALAVVFGLTLRNKPDKIRKIPLMVLAVFIVLLEASKQIYYNTCEPFTMYVLPLHFCSTFIWLIPLAQFTRGKFNDFVKPMPFCYSLVVAVLMYAFPRVLLGTSTADPTGNFHNVHTLLFHHVMVAYFAFSVALNDYTPRKRDWLPLTVGVIFYASYALPVAYLLNVNYVNILSSDFAPFEKLRLSAGQVVYNILLFAVAMSAILLIWLAYMGLTKLIQKSQNVYLSREK